jgi:hypothetical protein
MPFDRRVQVDIIRKGAVLALRVEGLRVVFDITKDSKVASNIAKIQIYNLAKNTRNERFQELKDQVIIRAGYADESLDEIFHGDLLTVSHPKQEADIVTSIEASDGQSALRTSHASLSYAEGASVKQVLQDVAKSMGLPVKSQDYLAQFQDEKFLQGFAFHGRAQDALSKVTARAGLEWSIQGNQLQILKRGGVLPQPLNQIPVLSPGHGLIGSPERLQRLGGDSPEKKPPGWKIKSVLVPRLDPGGQIGLQCDDVPRATAYRIQAVHHQGDTHGDDFFTETEALDPGVLIGGAS